MVVKMGEFKSCCFFERKDFVRLVGVREDAFNAKQQLFGDTEGFDSLLRVSFALTSRWSMDSDFFVDRGLGAVGFSQRLRVFRNW